MSVKAKRPLKDVIEARSLAAPKKSNAGAMDPKARTARAAKMAKFPSGMDRRSKNPATSAADNERPIFTSQMSHRKAKFPRTIPEDDFPSDERPPERHEPSKFPSGMDRRLPGEFPSKFQSGIGRRIPERGRFPERVPEQVSERRGPRDGEPGDERRGQQEADGAARAEQGDDLFNSGPSVEAFEHRGHVPRRS